MSRARREATFWLELWRAAPASATGSLVLVLLGAVASYGVMMGSALLVESLVQRDGQSLVWLGLTVGSLVVQPLASIGVEAAGADNQAGMTVRAQDLLARAALAPHGVEHLEDPGAAAALRGAAEHVRDSLQLDAVSEVWRWLGIRVRGLAALLVVGQWSWLAAVIVAGAQLLNSRSMMGYLKAVQADIFEQAAEEGRRASYAWSLLLTRQAGKEVRLFGLTDWLLGRYERLWRQAEHGILARRTAAVRPVYRSSLVLILVTLGALLWLAFDVWHGHVSVATMVAAAQGVAGLRAFGNLGDTLVQVTRAKSSALAAYDLGGAVPSTGDDLAPAVGTACEVRFDDVTFGYQSRGVPVFEHLSLHIPAGQSVAIVGVNGVGKSTLIKLLCGLYRPHAGTVTVDGRDPGTDDAARRRVGVSSKTSFATSSRCATTWPCPCSEGAVPSRNLRQPAREHCGMRPETTSSTVSKGTGRRCSTPGMTVAGTCLAGSGNASRWPVRSPPSTPEPACSCSMSRPPRSTYAPRLRSSVGSCRSPEV